MILFVMTMARFAESIAVSRLEDSEGPDWPLLWVLALGQHLSCSCFCSY